MLLFLNPRKWLIENLCPCEHSAREPSLASRPGRGWCNERPWRWNLISFMINPPRLTVDVLTPELFSSCGWSLLNPRLVPLGWHSGFKGWMVVQTWTLWTDALWHMELWCSWAQPADQAKNTSNTAKCIPPLTFKSLWTDFFFSSPSGHANQGLFQGPELEWGLYLCISSVFPVSVT